MKFFKFALLSTLLLSGCARDLSSNNYTSSSTSGVVLEGMVVSSRPVTVTESDRLGGNGTGAIGGGVAGGVAGSTIGRGRGSALGAVGGVIVGAVAGAVIQDQLSKSDGIEYIIKINRQNTHSYAPKTLVRDRDREAKTEIISVVQGKDVVLNNGQKVYIIYSDDRPRVVARD